MQTLVKFTLRLTTYVTRSPTSRRLSSSATISSAVNSNPVELNKSVPSSIILSEEIKEKILIEKTLSQKENKQINISVAKKGSKLKDIEQAIKNAKDRLNRKL